MLPLKSVTIKDGDRLSVIQHPAGGPKQLSFLSNIVAYADERRVQYLTETLPGSSGAPVFDSSWNVVALHHSGGWLTDPGSSDPKRAFLRNEGIAIGVIIASLRAQGITVP